MSDLPFHYPDEAPATPTGAGPRRHRHRWVTVQCYGSTTHTVCQLRGNIRDHTRFRRGKSARRLGGDQERRIERRFGPTKIGERGDPVDHLGIVWAWQAKATRRDPPLWLAAISEPTLRVKVPALLRHAFSAMAGLYEPRLPVVIRSYIHAGVRTKDWLFVRPADAQYWFGLGRPEDVGWWVIPGDWWLDHYGRDEPEGGTG